MSGRRVLVAPCSFKGSVLPRAAAEAIARGLRSAIPGADLDLCPLADGGEGTLDVLSERLGLGPRIATVRDPLGRRIPARYGLNPERGLAFIEAAAAIGLTLVGTDERDPIRASSFGLGELILEALDAGARAIWIGLGGTATADGGRGMLEALQGTKLGGVRVLAVCDVVSPLLGPRGARLYMPQKGASAEQCEWLEKRLARLAEEALEATGRPIAELAGAGAAGGLGAALGMLGAELVSGSELVLETLDVRARMARADLVVCGEGRIDEQTLEGKPILGLARLAREQGKPLVALCGSRAAELRELHAEGLTAALGILPGLAAEAEALAQGARNLELCAEELGRLLVALGA